MKCNSWFLQKLKNIEKNKIMVNFGINQQILILFIRDMNTVCIYQLYTAINKVTEDEYFSNIVC